MGNCNALRQRWNGFGTALGARVIGFKRPNSQVIRALVLGFSITSLAACGTLRQTPPVETSPQRMSLKPPFSTREPERYTALRVVTTEENFPDARPPNVQTITFTIIRDGGRRREEFQITDGKLLVYLESSEGFFVLAPDLKLFADISERGSTLLPKFEINPPEANLLPPLATEAIYEDLGIEQRQGKNVRKFRVTESGTSNGTATSVKTFVWIDEELGIPVRTESETSDEGVTRKFVNELRDISFKVEARKFEVPRDYLRIGLDEFSSRIFRKP